LRKWLALSGAERRVVVEAILLIAAFGLALKLLPFRAVVRRVQSLARSGTPVSAQRIGALVDAASRILHASCLPRAFALARMLASRGMNHELRVGVRRTGSGIAAHAWVSDESGVLVGGAGTDEYAPLLVYSTAR
jgi:Transglutaminase-like superfamily